MNGSVLYIESEEVPVQIRKNYTILHITQFLQLFNRIVIRILNIIFPLSLQISYKFLRLVPENPDLPENRIENKKSGRTMTVAAAKLV